MQDTMIGVDLAKNVFQLHGASMMGEVLFRKKLSRPRFLRFMAEQPTAVVVMEACSGASFWARQMRRLGHDVRLIAPQYVRPFVKRQKNDMADAEAIVVAAQRPEMRFVEPKTEEQQARAVLFRSRERLVHQRTELVNALRAVLYEFGCTVPKGIGHIRGLEALLEGRVSKAGQADIRRLLIIGAMSRLNWLGRRTIPEDSWLSRLAARKPRMLVAIALANKMARALWAMLTKNQEYRNPAEAVAA